MLSRALPSLCALALSGCFYNSAWHQQAVSERRVAESATPERVEVATRAERRRRPLRLRAYISPRYRGEVSGAMAHVEDLVDRASELTEEALGAGLVVAEVVRWELDAEEEIGASLDRLQALDPAEDVDLVVGFVGSLAMVETSIEQLGRAQLLGRHMVMRAPNDAVEGRAIERSFSRLSREEKLRLRRRRKDHRELVVFLHELGHTLGAIHVRDPGALMHARYSEDVDTFSSPTLALIRATLEERVAPPEERDPQRLAESLRAVLETQEIAFPPSDHAQMLEGLEGWVAAMAQASAAEASRAAEAPAAASTAAEPPPASALAGLDEEEARRFRAAKALADGGDVRGAWDALAPLVEARTDHYAVQELACELTMSGLRAHPAREACQRMVELATQPSGS